MWISLEKLDIRIKEHPEVLANWREFHDRQEDLKHARSEVERLEGVLKQLYDRHDEIAATICLQTGGHIDDGGMFFGQCKRCGAYDGTMSPI